MEGWQGWRVRPFYSVLIGKLLSVPVTTRVRVTKIYVMVIHIYIYVFTQSFCTYFYFYFCSAYSRLAVWAIAKKTKFTGWRRPSAGFRRLPLRSDHPYTWPPLSGSTPCNNREYNHWLYIYNQLYNIINAILPCIHYSHTVIEKTTFF